jgi:hypothetical protein
MASVGFAIKIEFWLYLLGAVDAYSIVTDKTSIMDFVLTRNSGKFVSMHIMYHLKRSLPICIAIMVWFSLLKIVPLVYFAITIIFQRFW